MLDFYAEELSGHLVANGDKGQYWIMDLDNIYLELINPTPAGPDIKKLGVFPSIGMAVEFAEHWEEVDESKI